MPIDVFQNARIRPREPLPRGIEAARLSCRIERSNDCGDRPRLRGNGKSCADNDPWTNRLDESMLAEALQSVREQSKAEVRRHWD